MLLHKQNNREKFTSMSQKPSIWKAHFSRAVHVILQKLRVVLQYLPKYKFLDVFFGKLFLVQTQTQFSKLVT